MRVLLSCLQSLKQHPLPAYDFWRPYFIGGCQEAGIEYLEVPEIDWVEGLIYSPGIELEKWRDRLWDKVLAFVRKEQDRQPVDFFLCYLYPKQVEVSAIIELQRMGIPCVNFFCDNVREFRKVPDEYRHFSLNWVPEFEALPMYQKAGIPHLHAPMPCWVPHELRTVPTTETDPPTFIGSADILRRDLFGHALQSGADFNLRGSGWQAGAESPINSDLGSRPVPELIANQISTLRTHGMRGLYHKMENHLRPLQHPVIPETRIGSFLSKSEYIRVTREAMVAIGVNRVPTAWNSDHHPLTYSRLRDVEAPMMGACYLTEWTPGLEELYDLGGEIESYRTPDELAAKLSELKRDSARRRLMRERAQKRALTDHSVANSLGRICKRLF